MLFLIKRTVTRSLFALAVLAGVAWMIRANAAWEIPDLEVSRRGVVTGLLLCGLVLVIDGVTHCLCTLLLDETYLRYFHELAAQFRGQDWLAILAGSLLAGIGEELLFRGTTLSPVGLCVLAVLFGCAHHIRRSLWPMTLWSVWEGLLFVVALLWTGNLFAVMLAHALHDAIGFGIFRLARELD